MFLPGRKTPGERTRGIRSWLAWRGLRLSRSVTAATLCPSGPSGASSRKAWCTTMAPVCGVWLASACGKSSAVVLGSILGRAALGGGGLDESGALRLRLLHRKRMQGCLRGGGRIAIADGSLTCRVVSTAAGFAVVGGGSRTDTGARPERARREGAAHTPRFSRSFCVPQCSPGATRCGRSVAC